MRKLYKYQVTWLLADGEKVIKDFEAHTYGVEPNGITVFVVFPTVTGVEFTANPQGGPPQQQPEAVGAVSGYNIIERL